MIKEILTKIFFPVKDIFAQVYYPVFERQYIDPLTFKENSKGFNNFYYSNSDGLIIMTLIVLGIVILVILLSLIYKYYKKAYK